MKTTIQSYSQQSFMLLGAMFLALLFSAATMEKVYSCTNDGEKTLSVNELEAVPAFQAMAEAADILFLKMIEYADTPAESGSASAAEQFAEEANAVQAKVLALYEDLQREGYVVTEAERTVLVQAYANHTKSSSFFDLDIWAERLERGKCRLSAYGDFLASGFPPSNEGPTVPDRLENLADHLRACNDL